ncbi:beta galactofuranosyl glycosyltransferase [Trypanosoma theileri]|uniref:Beta galactofuranosyl glycosyltransferase n=1 Tax=Trypanosoma theileri TaxID=67003 RepID=A0A1X0NWM3_9TRYP|nr:beta galactofuranosyl glycosyltransferase [Trypanosoma theileri]ORC89095.1 beta galactofuranosyl glycosyltransferase [Trypanosoma theileri]
MLFPLKKSLTIIIVFGILLLMLLLVLLLQITVVESDLTSRPLSEPPPSVRPNHYLRCVGERLLVDAESRWVGNNSGPGVLPMMVVPLMLDLPDFRELMCNITVPVRLLVLVQNGEEPQLSAFLQSLLDAYGWSGRLVVRHHAENIGYSGAVNVGLRLALSRPREEVPFVFITNSDVTFSPDLLPRLLQEVHTRTQKDAARIDQLEAEVQREPSGHAPAGRRAKVLRSPHGNSSLSTSALLPDRIRYAPAKERANAFSEHYGLFCMNLKESCFTSVILTRLAISSVGFFDENFYPSYVEDIDYDVRRRLLGFKKYVTNYGTFVHISNLNLRAARFTMTPTALWFRRAFELKAMRIYAFNKWNTDNAGPGSFDEPFNGIIPVDVWVRDDEMIKKVQEYAQMMLKQCPILTYNTDLLHI